MVCVKFDAEYLYCHQSMLKRSTSFSKANISIILKAYILELQ